MANKVTLTAQDGSAIEFYDEIKAQGGVKDVYFSTDKTYVVAFTARPFLQMIRIGWKILLGLIISVYLRLWRVSIGKTI